MLSNGAVTKDLFTTVSAVFAPIASSELAEVFAEPKVVTALSSLVTYLSKVATDAVLTIS